MIYKLEHKDFEYISKRVYDYSKINLTEKKKSLIVSRLTKRLKAVGVNSISDYIKYLEFEDENNKEFLSMIDALSTNYSLFFREIHHFDFLKKDILPDHHNKNLNIWSAASSTGQEIYSILMTIEEYQKSKSIKINYNLFASDISRNVLLQASKGLYDREDIKHMHHNLLKKFFLEGTGEKKDKVKIKNQYIKKVKFFRLNLNEKKYNVPMMDIIFLRNIIIYFDKESKIEIINRLYDYLKPGGYFILGHSESLTGISNKLKHIGKSIYIKEVL